MRAPAPRTAFLTSAALGLVLMIGFDATITRIVGVACLLAALVLGVAAIATPEFLAADAEDVNPAASAGPAANDAEYDERSA